MNKTIGEILKKYDAIPIKYSEDISFFTDDKEKTRALILEINTEIQKKNQELIEELNTEIQKKIDEAYKYGKVAGVEMMGNETVAMLETLKENK